MRKFFQVVNVLNEYNVLWSWVITLVSIGLIITSFILPPAGVIDSTVFAAVGEMGALKVVLFDLTKMIEAGYEIHYKDLFGTKKKDDENEKD